MLSTYFYDSQAIFIIIFHTTSKHESFFEPHLISSQPPISHSTITPPFPKSEQLIYCMEIAIVPKRPHPHPHPPHHELISPETTRTPDRSHTCLSYLAKGVVTRFLAPPTVAMKSFLKKAFAAFFFHLASFSHTLACIIIERNKELFPEKTMDCAQRKSRSRDSSVPAPRFRNSRCTGSVHTVGSDEV
ncbi:hypothetical protein EJ08DRAFT_102716 [Tothia fuscella]|uniref:Uncharacterized protein n=1 Tax=Tothia fuscella TaxID=1048955 RepID=A0A9P4NWL3_9PEZI|nr:hypothetical protein EJ08DRAFT_102716 [Tothia fuscella]